MNYSCHFCDFNRESSRENTSLNVLPHSWIITTFFDNDLVRWHFTGKAREHVIFEGLEFMHSNFTFFFKKVAFWLSESFKFYWYSNIGSSEYLPLIYWLKNNKIILSFDVWGNFKFIGSWHFCVLKYILISKKKDGD